MKRPEEDMTNRVLIESEHPSFRPLERRLASVVRKALRYLRKENCAVELTLLTDGTMRDYNRRFRRKDKPATVLSFDAKRSFPRPDLRGRRYLGELFLAPRYIKSVHQDVDLITVHGVLHLFGYTHGRRRARITMERRERALGRALGKK